MTSRNLLKMTRIFKFSVKRSFYKEIAEPALEEKARVLNERHFVMGEF
jgi:hypothetical protein